MHKRLGGVQPFVTFSKSGKHVKSVLQDSVGEGPLTDKEPDEQRCEAGEEQEPHEDPDHYARLVFGRLLLFAG